MAQIIPDPLQTNIDKDTKKIPYFDAQSSRGSKERYGINMYDVLPKQLPFFSNIL